MHTYAYLSKCLLGTASTTFRHYYCLTRPLIGGNMTKYSCWNQNKEWSQLDLHQQELAWETMASSVAHMNACSGLDIEPLDLAIYFTDDGQHAPKTALQEYLLHSCEQEYNVGKLGSSHSNYMQLHSFESVWLSNIFKVGFMNTGWASN